MCSGYCHYIGNHYNRTFSTYIIFWNSILYFYFISPGSEQNWKCRRNLHGIACRFNNQFFNGSNYSKYQRRRNLYSYLYHCSQRLMSTVYHNNFCNNNNSTCRGNHILCRISLLHFIVNSSGSIEYR